MIAITVSTNYSDILPFALEANLGYFERWFIVTDKNDEKTIKLLEQEEKVEIVLFDFKNYGCVFNKGGAVRAAQELAYEQFPDEWYLLVDSDICLTEDIAQFVDINFAIFDEETIYGAGIRHEFRFLSDYKKHSNYLDFPYANQLQGYFQLYKKKVFYAQSYDCSQCDLLFLENFEKHSILKKMVVCHLGSAGNWTGREIGSDFVIDI